MAAEFLRGNRTWLYWGQAHGSTVGAIPLAILFWIGGVGVWALAVTAQAWSAALAGCTYWYSRTLGCTPGFAALVASVAWSAPTVAFVNNSKELIYFTPAIVAGLASLTLATGARSKYSPRSRWRRGACSGLLGGLAVWVNPGALYLVLPAGVVFLRSTFEDRSQAGSDNSSGTEQREWIRAVGGWFLGAFVGVLPWLIALGGRARDGTEVAFSSAYPPVVAGPFRRLFLFFTEQLPGLAGLKLPFSESETSPYLFAPVAIPLAVIAIVVAWRSVDRARTTRSGRGALVALAAAPWIWVAISGVVGASYQNLRYTYYLYPLLVVLVVVFRSTMQRRIAMAAAIMLLTVVTVSGYAGIARANPLTASEPLAAWLVSEGIECVVNEYSFGGYAVGLASGGEVTVVPASLESNPEFRERAASLSTCAWAIADRSTLRPPFDRLIPSNEIDSAALTAWLDEQQISYRRAEIGGTASWPRSAPGFEVIIPERVVLPGRNYTETGNLVTPR